MVWGRVFWRACGGVVVKMRRAAAFVSAGCGLVVGGCKGGEKMEVFFSVYTEMVAVATGGDGFLGGRK